MAINVDSLELKLDKLSKADITAALTKACLLVEGDAKINCPVDTGMLRNSITYEIDGNTGYVGTNVENALYVEIGTGIHSSQGNGRQTAWRYQTPDGKWHTTYGQKPQPFLQPALAKNKNKIKQIFADEIKRQAK